MKKISVLAVFALILCGMSTVQGSVFNNSTGLAGIGVAPFYTMTFDGMSLGQNTLITNQLASSGVTFDSPIFYDGNSGGVGCTQFNGVSGDCITNFQSSRAGGLLSTPTPFSILFGNMQTYAAFAIVTDNNGVNNTTVQALNKGVVVDSIRFTTGSLLPQNATTANFVGFYDENFDTIRVVSTGLNLVLIDNLQVSSVPEPGTVVLLALGLGCVIGVARLRRTA